VSTHAVPAEHEKSVDFETKFRRLPIGAELTPGGGVHFRVWAPEHQDVTVVVYSPSKEAEDGERIERAVPLQSEGNGYFSTWVREAAAGDRYGFRLRNEERLYPDPASRFQPDGPHGLSQVVDPSLFTWTDQDWKGVVPEGQVIYEMHIGTFTEEGTWEAACRYLPKLAEMGITVLEVMPVNDFPGRFGWGYDGVNFFAPTRLYGVPDDFRRFVDQAHSLGLGVILDVVYNHAGPDGNYLPQFAQAYFTDKHMTDWGPSFNLDGEHSESVREFFLSNVEYWIDEFHLDGLRIDATQDIHDDSPKHILAEIVERVRAAAKGRSTFIVAENEPQDPKLLRSPEKGGYGIDAAWNDDFHHTAMVQLTGRAEAYYTDYCGSPQEFISAAKYGFLFQGQWYTWQKQRRGKPALDLLPHQLITFIQNHDQLANTGRGLRCHTISSSGCYRAMTALMLLGPGTPMLFQGQEFAASSPFFYFADHHDELAQLVHQGRRKFMSQFRSLAVPEVQKSIPDPSDPRTFFRSKLDQSERESHAEATAMHRDLLRLRREHPVFWKQRRGGMDGAVLSDDAFVLRFFGPDNDDRLLIVNFGPDLHYSPAPEPLLAPPAGRRWETLWSSEDLSYGGSGTAPLDTEDNWRIPGHAAVVLWPLEIHQEQTA